MAVDIEREALVLLCDAPSMRILADEGVTPEHFFDLEAAEIFGWATNYYHSHGKSEATPTVDMMVNVFPPDPAAGHIGFIAMVHGATGGMAATYIAEEIRKKFIKKELQDVITDSLTGLRVDPIVTASDLQTKTSEIINRSARSIDRIEYARDLTSIRARDEQMRAAGGAKKVPYFLSGMSEYVGGIEVGELHFLLGQPAMGKSFFGCAQALGSVMAGWDTYYATLEMGRDVIRQRIEALEAQTISLRSYRKNELLPNEWTAIEEAQDRIANAPGKLVIEFLHRGERTPSNIISRARMSGCEFIVVDQLQFMEHPDGNTGTRPELTEGIIYNLKDEVNGVAGKMPCLLLHQFNRQVKDAQYNIGKMQDIAHSSTVEQVADAVFAIGRDNEMVLNQQMYLATLKARNFTPAAWCLNWDLERRARIDVEGQIPWAQ